MSRMRRILHTWPLKQAEMLHLNAAALAAVAVMATFLTKVCTFFPACLAFALTGPYMYSQCQHRQHCSYINGVTGCKYMLQVLGNL